MQRDFLVGARLSAGNSVATTVSREITRGTWKLHSSNGHAETAVKDGGGFPMGTILIGSGEDGVGVRSIKFPLPGDLVPERMVVRVFATEGESLRFRVHLIGPEGTSVSEEVGLTPNAKPTDIAVALPHVPGATSGVIQIEGDCQRPTFLKATVFEDMTADAELDRSYQGVGLDQRSAVGLGAGAVVENELNLKANSRLTLSLLAGSTTAGRLQADWILDGEVVTSQKFNAGEEWGQSSMEIPAGGNGTLRFSNEGPADLWLAEERIDSIDPGSAPTYFLVTSDTHRGDHIGRFDETARVRTPTLDELADRGITFTNCYSATNVTNPSHIAMMTGLPLRDTRIANNATALSLSATTIAEAFQSAGYRTFAATSVMHLKPAQSGLHQGFDRYEAPLAGERNGSAAVDRLLDWIPEADGAPLFVWLHVYDAHAPYSPPSKLVDKHYPAGRDPRDPSKELGIPESVLAPWITSRKYTDRAYLDALYAAGVDYVDGLMGRMLAVERLADGVIAFTADHGESLGVEGVWWDHSRLNYDTVHIPMLLSYPGVTPMRTDAPVELIDLGRTLLNLASIDTPFPGRDLHWGVNDATAVEPRFSLAAHGWSAAVEVDGWMMTLHIGKYPRPFSTKTWEHGETQLYNLNEDPTASTDVLEANFPRAKKMRAALVKWLQGANETGLGVDIELSADAKASLEALGYGGGTEGKAEGSWWRPDPNAHWNKRFAD